MEIRQGQRVEELLQHREWLVRLSRTLVADPSLAEDLAQDALVRALTHPSSIRSWKRWLRTVLKNLSIEAGRSSRRRSAREVAATSDLSHSAPAAADVVARAATQHQVVEAVLCLKEPYRSCVLLRFFDDLRPAAIAARLGVPVSTVETRIQRGIGLLRIELDRFHGGDRQLWLQGVCMLVARADTATIPFSGGLIAGVCVVVAASVGGWAYLSDPPRPLPQEIAMAPAAPSDRAPVDDPVPDPPLSEDDPTQDPGAAPGREMPEPSIDLPVESSTSLDVSPSASALAIRPTSVDDVESTDAGRVSAEWLIKLGRGDTRRLRELFARYFEAKVDKDYPALTKSYEELVAAMDGVARARNVDTLLAYPEWVRGVMGAAIRPPRMYKKGLYLESTLSKALRSGPFHAGYLRRVPKSYRSGEPMPVVISLADPTGSAEEQARTEQARQGDREDAIVLIPLSGEAERWTSLEGRMAIFFALLELKSAFDLDLTQILLTGAPHTEDELQTLVKWYPGTFSGVHFVAEKAEAADEPLSGNARYVRVFRGPTGVPSDPDGLTFPFAAKVLAPDKVELTTSSLEIANAYWLHLTDFSATEAAPITVLAEIDRASNTVVIDAPPAVREVVVYVNDAILDLDRPIVVRRAGDVFAPSLFEGAVERSLDRALVLWYENRSGNSGEVYVNWIEVDLR